MSGKCTQIKSKSMCASLQKYKYYRIFFLASQPRKNGDAILYVRDFTTNLSRDILPCVCRFSITLAVNMYYLCRALVIDDHMTHHMTYHVSLQF